MDIRTVTLTLRIQSLFKVMPNLWVMGNNSVKYYPDPTWQWGVKARKQFFDMMYGDLDIIDMTLGQGYDTLLGHRQ